MSIEVTGKIYLINDTQQITEKFSKREFVVEVEDGKYPQFVLFQMTGDRCSNLDSFRVADEVRVEFNLRGREWTSPKGEVRYFNSLDVWRMDNIGRPQEQEQSSEPPPPYGPSADMDEDSDIPF